MNALFKTVWGELHSRQPARIRAAFDSLSSDEKAAAMAHLTRMSGEADWHPEQVKSTDAALDALKEAPQT